MMSMAASKRYCLTALAVIGVALGACEAEEPSKRSSEAVFVPLGNNPEGNRKPDRVTVGMSFSEVEALMGQSQQTCWNYQDAGAERTICFRDRKLSVISPSEESRGLTLGASPRQVAGLLGTPRVVVEHSDDSMASYRATFVDGKLATLQNITPPVH